MSLVKWTKPTIDTITVPCYCGARIQIPVWVTEVECPDCHSTLNVRTRLEITVDMSHKSEELYRRQRGWLKDRLSRDE